MQDAHNPTYGPMVYIASYNNQPSEDSTIMVFSNCDAVKLYRNNTFLGEMTRRENAATAPFVAAKGGSPYFLFHTGKYEAGTLKAVGMMKDAPVCTHIVQTPLAPHHLEITIPEELTAFPANGWEMTPFYVKVCDQNGTVVANQTAGQSYQVHISVNGAGSLMGGNIPTTGVSPQQTEGGIAYGIIRHGSKPGKIVIRAETKEGLSVEKVINTAASNTMFVKDGKHPHWADENKIMVAAAKETAVVSNALHPITLTGKPLSVTPVTNQERIPLITDNNTATGWAAGTTAFPLSITIDLQGNYQLTGSRIVWGKDSDWYIYSITVSTDGEHWTTVKNAIRASGQDYKPVAFDQPGVRYVRFQVTGIQPESSKVAIREIAVYGEKR